MITYININKSLYTIQKLHFTILNMTKLLIIFLLSSCTILANQDSFELCKNAESISIDFSKQDVEGIYSKMLSSSLKEFNLPENEFIGCLEESGVSNEESCKANYNFTDPIILKNKWNLISKVYTFQSRQGHSIFVGLKQNSLIVFVKPEDLIKFVTNQITINKNDSIDEVKLKLCQAGKIVEKR